MAMFASFLLLLLIWMQYANSYYATDRDYGNWNDNRRNKINPDFF